ncbi:hypothetical protein [Variovorax rhizosphaerae]|uniref:Lipoprotein n=1 Tax=Variovorax rhizosphaerae TaxID=1836200 RepID=A0ABU8WII2_9BURK
MRPTRIAAALLLALPTLGVQAACENGLAERMHAKLNPDRHLDEERAACKPWPAYPGRSIVVLPMPRPSSEPGVTSYDVEVLVIQRPDNGNTERDTILARAFEPNALTEDAITIQDIRIDTGRYTLAANTRAFGIRIRYRGASRVNPYSSETLQLYVAQGTKVRKVLDEIELDMDGGEWDATCTGHFEQVRGTLAVGQGVSEGFADLVVHRTQTENRAEWQESGECIEKALPVKLRTFTLHYDGERYPIPKALRTE